MIGHGSWKSLLFYKEKILIENKQESRYVFQ